MVPLVLILGCNLGKVDKPGTLGLRVESLEDRGFMMVIEFES